MLKDVIWSEDGTYTPQGQHTPIEFFDNALQNSTSFDLELGYFNSAAISVLSRSFATFISNGGRMRMAINHIVSRKDKDTIAKGQKGLAESVFDLDDFNTLYQSLDDYGEHFFRCLAYLIQAKRIDIVIIRPKGSSGLSHTKRGQFADGVSVVSFTGSANFTLGGLINNLEDIYLLFSTSPDERVQNRIEMQRARFDELMEGNCLTVEYLSADDLQEAICSKYGGHEIEELLDVEAKLQRIKRRYNVEQTIDMVGEEESSYARTPRFPYESGPREYQKLAFENWKANGQKGLFAMATGTGKTITSLNCLLEIYKRCGYYKALILVPTITLVNQWEEECRKFRFDNTIKVCSKNALWKAELNRLAYEEKFAEDGQKQNSYVIISTYASFCRESIFHLLNSFDRRRMLLIADEAHNMGAPLLMKRLKDINYLRRIGLSATPERQFDDETNRRIFSFFGAEERFTYEYNMREAIENGVLCRYYYYPHLVRLTEEEMMRYVELSVKIAKYFNFNTGCFEHGDDILTALLLARKRIVHKAANKLGVFTEILKQRFKEKGDLRYTLVYVPEGNRPDYLTDTEFYASHDEDCEDSDSAHLIDVFTKAVTQIDPYVTVRQFVSGMKDRDALLDEFASGRIQVLTSMKCLDEGVDVPRSEMAIFCASTGNPRQFIQRRGRILRMHKDKVRAVIHDLVVVPEVNPALSSFPMERSLLKGELLRVKDFSLLSENSSHTEEVLADVMNYYNLNLYQNE